VGLWPWSAYCALCRPLEAIATPYACSWRLFHACVGLALTGITPQEFTFNLWFCIALCIDVWQDSLIGKERMSQPVGGNKMATKSVIKVKELRDLAAGMKINLVVTKRGSGFIIVDCDSEIQLQRFVQTLEIALIQVFIDTMNSKRAYVSDRAFAEVK
jgi:hypothetical protein